MPWVTINLMEGHSKDQKKELFKSVTESISKTLGLPQEHVRIQLVEMSEDNHAIAGTAIEDMKE